MRIKDKIWNEDRHWFTFKFSLIFLLVGFICTILMILELTIWNKNPVICVILMISELVFYSIFFAPIIKEFVV